MEQILATQLVKAEVIINTADKAQREAFEKLMDTLHVSSAVQCTMKKEEQPASASQTQAQSAKEEPAPEEVKIPKRRASRPTKEEAADYKAKVEAKALAEGKGYTVEDVRARLKEKVSDHRPEIKAKLEELGAPNVSSLDPGLYPQFMDYLESLS